MSYIIKEDPMATDTNTPPALEVDVLEEDIITVPGQTYALVSFVSPTGNQRNDKFGMKLRGVFATREEAASHVKRIQKFDNRFDVYLVELYKWLLIPPTPDDVPSEYQEQFLQDMIKGYNENQELARQHFLERKDAVMKEGLDKHLTEEERLPPPPASVVAQLDAGKSVAEELDVQKEESA